MSLRAFLGKNKIEISLFFLLIISLGLKFYRLSNPKSYYFDEIYFAFTAEEMAKGNRAAWELGHEAPKGFAYEWTHPQLGKEMSALGILIFGDSPFGWRFFQALFGGFGTLIIYILGKELFESKRAGIIRLFYLRLNLSSLCLAASLWWMSLLWFLSSSLRCFSLNMLGHQETSF